MGPLMQPKRIAILGSTGSVGRQALDIIASAEAGRFEVCALSGGGNWRLLAEQACATGAGVVAIADAAVAGNLAGALADGTTVLSGSDALADAVRRCQPDLVMTAVTGSAGLAPTLAAIDCGADLAVANKESLVMAGAVIVPAARAAGVNLLPVDSEHSAVFQCLTGRGAADVRRVILTASGGPFRDWPASRVRDASLEEVLNHPTWQMGRKITIDSATLLNKALEVIEAHWLFDLPAEKIEVVIHPESVVHACVEFADGTVLAQMGPPSMATPIALALYWPDRAPAPAAPLDLAAAGGLHFDPPDAEQYPALDLGYEVLRRGGTAGAVLNAANEVAVAAFVAGRIGFGQIVEIVRKVLNQTPVKSEVTLEAIVCADAEARRQTESIVARVGAPAGDSAESAV